MASYNMITIYAPNETDTDMIADLVAPTSNRHLAGQKLMKFIRSLMGGVKSAKVTVGGGAVKATGTVTLSSHVATNTVTVNGITFTCMPSGATGNQYNVGGDDEETAENLAAALNANTTLDGMLTASAASGVVTLTANYPGELGNAVTLAISANGTVSAARMASGTNGTSEITHYYGSSY